MTDGRVGITGYAAYTSPIPPAAATRERGIAMAKSARAAVKDGCDDAEAQARAALEVLVDAFLIDRRGNRDCFTRAHALGRRINFAFGCHAGFVPDQDAFINSCGVLALHNRFGLSVGGATTGVCSICGAGDFECDHVPGRAYGDERCQRIVVRWDVREVSLVRQPYDPRCYRIQRPETRPEVELALGRALAPEEEPRCDHCRVCSGRHGPTEADLDPSSWDSLIED